VETLTTKSEPKGKLDTMATQTTDGAQATLADVGVVNGPEDDPLDWHAIDWRAAEEDVRRLRQRIFTASRVGDLKRVRSLQKLMLRSRANTLLSVRRVTELNAGRKTAGVDGKVVLLSSVKAEMVDRVQRHTGPWQARPVKRVYTSYSEIGIAGITPILGLFRCPLLRARDGPVTWDDGLWRLSPVGIIRCHSLSPHRRWMMSSRSCHSGVGRGLWVVALFAFSRAWRFISVSACA
jgi:hypothetical protein